MYKVVGYAKCSCGAYTIELEDLETSKTKTVNYKGTLKQFCLLPEITNTEITVKLKFHKDLYDNCNYCVNNWGLDLCGCGSGEKFGKCKNGLNVCTVPSQSL